MTLDEMKIARDFFERGAQLATDFGSASVNALVVSGSEEYRLFSNSETDALLDHVRLMARLVTLYLRAHNAIEARIAGASE